MPCERGAFHSCRKFAHAFERFEFAEIHRRKFPGGITVRQARRNGREPGYGFFLAQADDGFGQQGRRRDRDGATRAFEARRADIARVVDVQVELQFVTAQRIDALGAVRGMWQFAEMPRAARVVEDEFSIQLA